MRCSGNAAASRGSRLLMPARLARSSRRCPSRKAASSGLRRSNLPPRSSLRTICSAVPLPELVKPRLVLMRMKPAVLGADARDLRPVRARELRPQQVPARVADHGVLVALLRQLPQQRLQMLLADREDDVAGRDRRRRHPAQPLVARDQPRNFFVDRGDTVARRVRRLHRLGVERGQRLEQDDPRRHAPEIALHQPFLPNDDLIPGPHREGRDQQLRIQLPRRHLDRQIEEGIGHCVCLHCWSHTPSPHPSPASR